MKPLRIYIENFMCYDHSFIDFTQFSAALIVGKKEDNENYSNAVGKTSIFRSIEYVLFNQADANLEKIIRDDTTYCKVTIDFIVDSIEYRLSRTRTRKGTSDLSLYRRNANLGTEEEVLHTTKKNIRNIVIPNTSDKFWDDISGRRTADTEKDLNKLLKFNFKSFRNIIHFQQNVFDGLATATPEKRKGILKDVLDIVIYSKLEKISKDTYNILLKDFDKVKLLIENIGNPELDLKDLNNKFLLLSSQIDDKQTLLNESISKVEENLFEINKLTTSSMNLDSKLSSSIEKEQALNLEKSKIETSIKEYGSKKTNIIKSAKILLDELKELKDIQKDLISLDYSQMDILSDKNSSLKDLINQNDVIIKSNLVKLEELNIPLPQDNSCKHCRQPLTPEHKLNCQNQINNEIDICNSLIKKSKQLISKISPEISNNDLAINSLALSKQKLEVINSKISLKNKEISDKKSIHEEYSVLLKKFDLELLDKKTEIENLKDDLKKLSIDESLIIKEQIRNLKKDNLILNEKIDSLRNDINLLSNSKAVIIHSIDQKNQDKIKLLDYKKNELELSDKIDVYNSVIQAFSSTGIPNLIIQNVLDDLQIEANLLLNQLKPGLQLSFFVEKTVEKTGNQADTLDINYNVNGKDRCYEFLSGAQKLAVSFSLKLGLSFLLQKMIGIDVKFLLLDEIDQPLDKAGVDAYADIIKFFQKDFTMLIITHNDRLKDKFSHAILVEQDIDMVSRARVVSSW